MIGLGSSSNVLLISEAVLTVLVGVFMIDNWQFLKRYRGSSFSIFGQMLNMIGAANVNRKHFTMYGCLHGIDCIMCGISNTCCLLCLQFEIQLYS